MKGAVNPCPLNKLPQLFNPPARDVDHAPLGEPQLEIPVEYMLPLPVDPKAEGLGHIDGPLGEGRPRLEADVVDVASPLRALP